MTQAPGYSALRRGRVSVPFATYFVTLCTYSRAAGLHAPACTERIFAEVEQMEKENILHLRIGTIMQDHAHFVIKLGSKLTLSKTVARLKSKTKDVLASNALTWQESFYDHRMRPEEPVGPVFHYIFMNAYRKGLVETSKQWPGFRCSAEDWMWFGPLLNEACPWPAWLTSPGAEESAASGLPTADEKDCRV